MLNAKKFYENISRVNFYIFLKNYRKNYKKLRIYLSSKYIEKYINF